MCVCVLGHAQNLRQTEDTNKQASILIEGTATPALYLEGWGLNGFYHHTMLSEDICNFFSSVLLNEVKRRWRSSCSHEATSTLFFK